MSDDRRRPQAEANHILRRWVGICFHRGGALLASDGFRGSARVMGDREWRVGWPAWNDVAVLSMKTKVTTVRLTDTRAFYQSAFGLRVVEEWDEPDDKGVILGLPEGKQEALLEMYEGQVTQDFVDVSLQFRVDDLESFIRSLPDHLSYEGPNPRPWGSRYLYLRDPNGIQVIVYEGGW